VFRTDDDPSFEMYHGNDGTDVAAVYAQRIKKTETKLSQLKKKIQSRLEASRQADLQDFRLEQLCARPLKSTAFLPCSIRDFSTSGKKH